MNADRISQCALDPAEQSAPPTMARHKCRNPGWCGCKAMQGEAEDRGEHDQIEQPMASTDHMAIWPVVATVMNSGMMATNALKARALAVIDITHGCQSR